MSGSVDLVGLDRVIAKLQKVNLTKVIVSCKNDKKFEQEVSGNITKEDIISELEDQFADIPESNYKIYKLSYWYKDLNNKNKDLHIDFCFYTNQSGVSHWDKKEDKNMAGIVKAAEDRAFTNGQLSERVKTLENELAKMNSEDEDDTDSSSVGEKIADVLLPFAPQFMAGVMNFMNRNQPMAVAGVPSDINQLMTEMLAIEPEFPEHLSMLINLRKDKPAIYTMALNQLKNL